MSKQEKPFTKRQIQIIVKIAFLEAMLIVFVLPNVQSTGEIPSAIPDCTNNVPTVLQCGQVQLSLALGSSTAFTNVPFSVAFAKNPNVTIQTLIAPGAGMYVTSFTFQAPGNSFSTWTSMPAAETYIYSPGVDANTCCTITYNPAGMSNIACTFDVNVHVASTSATAKLIVRTANAATIVGGWSDIGSTPISSTGVSETVISFPISSSNALGFLSIWGINGNGVGDNPQFSDISMHCQPANNAWNTIVYGISTTSFNVQITLGANAIFASTPTFEWKAING